VIRNIFLDCDGTVLEFVPGTNRGPRNLDELIIREDVVDFLQFNSTKFHAFLITNQPDVSRGHANLHELEYIYSKLMHDFPIIQNFRVCPHDNHHNCLCRKPKPGMIESLMHLYGINKEESLVIGDTWIDVLTAQNLGLRSVLINKPHSWLANSQGSPPSGLQADFQIQTFGDLDDSFFMQF
jgi:D-glycero-D-manno-heptose 1,7-bisphosphate phosphatase